MSKACSLSAISGRFNRWEHIPETSQVPQLLESVCFLSRKNDSNISLAPGKRMLAVNFDVGLLALFHRSESTWIIFLFLVFTMYPWKCTPSHSGIHRKFLFCKIYSFRNFLKYGRISKIRQPPCLYLAFDNRWTTVNVSISWLLNLQLSRLFFTRSVDLSLFEIASESTGRLENESMCKERIINIYDWT